MFQKLDQERQSPLHSWLAGTSDRGTFNLTSLAATVCVLTLHSLLMSARFLAVVVLTSLVTIDAINWTSELLLDNRDL